MTDGSTGALASFRSVWQHRRWRWLLGATVVSLVGDFLYWVAIVVYFTAHDHASVWLAASLLARLLPYVFILPIGGALADRFDRRFLLVGLDVARGAAFVLMAAFVAADAPPILVIGLVAFVASAGAVFRPTRVAVVPQLVPENDIAAANAGEEGLAQLSWFVGPALGAVLVTVLDPAIVLLIDAGTFALSALMIARIGSTGGRRLSRDKAEGSPSLLDDVRAGGRTILGDRGLAGLTLMMLGTAIAFGAEQVLYVLVAADRLDFGAEGIGYILAAMGVGGLLSAPLAARAGNSRRGGQWLLGSAILVCLPLVLISFTQVTVIVLALAVVEGAAAIVFGVASVTLLQRAVEESTLGRVYSVFDAAGALGQTIGSVAAPVLVAIAGLTAAMQMTGAAAIVLVVLLAPAVVALARSTDDRRRRHRATAIWLGEIAELASFEPVELERLARASGDRHIPAGTVVITEGDAADDLYVVRSGHLSVRTKAQAGEASQPPDLGPNDVFGEIGLLRRTARMATVTAITDVDLLAIEGAVFVAVATPSAPATAPLIGGMRSRLQLTYPHVDPDEPIEPGTSPLEAAP
jgi:MFS family permease